MEAHVNGTVPPKTGFEDYPDFVAKPKVLPAKKGEVEELKDLLVAVLEIVVDIKKCEVSTRETLASRDDSLLQLGETCRSAKQYLAWLKGKTTEVEWAKKKRQRQIFWKEVWNVVSMFGGVTVGAVTYAILQGLGVI